MIHPRATNGVPQPSVTFRRVVRIAAFLGFSLVPGLAFACPSCFSASNEGVLRTYYLTAAFMTVLPLVMVGGFATWIYRKSKQAPAVPEGESGQPS